MIHRMLLRRRSQLRFHRARRGAVGTLVYLAALIVIPAAIVAGVAVGIHPSGGTTPVAPGGPGISVTIRVSPCLNSAPIPLISCTTQPLTLLLYAEVIDVSAPYVFLWNFGDGSVPGLGQTLTHTFPNCNLYTVTVVVLDEMGTGSNSTTVYPCTA